MYAERHRAGNRHRRPVSHSQPSAVRDSHQRSAALHCEMQPEPMVRNVLPRLQRGAGACHARSIAFHTAASLAIASGTNIKVVQTMLGHASATLTWDRTGHLYPDELDAVADRIDEAARASAD